MTVQQNLLLTNTVIEIVQTIKQNKSGIRNAPGTALKNAINGEVIYTPPCCEDVLRDKMAALEQFINDPIAQRLIHWLKWRSYITSLKPSIPLPMAMAVPGVL